MNVRNLDEFGFKLIFRFITYFTLNSFLMPIKNWSILFIITILPISLTINN